VITLFMCGDVMLGRGIDQILPHRGDPVLEEGYVTDAGQYVPLAESLNGPIARPVDFAWSWGESLQVLDDVAPEARIINLETSITRSSEFAPGKAVHYRMSPANVPTLSALHPSVCALANNHVLDFGRAGLDETLDTLATVGLRAAGAGTDAQRAREPAAIALPGGGRLLVFSCGLASSGIPPDWAASPTRSTVAVEATMSVNMTVARDRLDASWSEASMARPLAPHSTVTHGLSPMTHLSWPGGISKTVPGPISSASPSSMTIRKAPDIVYPKWRIWQDVVPTSGATSLDHRQPGSNVQ